MSMSENIALGVYLTLTAMSVLLNGTFLIVICKSWTLVKRKRITYQVTNLAMADFTVGASTFGYHISIIAAASTTLNSALTTISWTAALASLTAVSLMAIERALCIKKPHTWNQILSLKRILIIMTGIWVLTLALAILMYFYTLTMMFVLLVLFYVPIFVTVVMYTTVYLMIWKAKSHEIMQSSSETINERRNNLMQRKVGSFVLILTLLLFITVSPSFLNLAVKNACELFKLNCNFIDTLKMLQRYFLMLELVNYAANPIIYIWRISMYRKAFWKMFGNSSENSTVN